MITESFINSCFTLLLNKGSIVKKSKALYRDISEVLTFNETRESYEIPLIVKNKLECLKKILSFLADDKSVDSIVDSISFSEKYKQYIDFIDARINEHVGEEIFHDTIRQIRLRKKIAALFQNYDELNKVLDSIKEGSFDSIDDLVEDYEVTIKTLYSNMMQSNRDVTIKAAASLDLTKDNFDSVIDMIKKKYDRKNKTPTGFGYIDNTLLFGGYEPSRLYVFAGGSGAGKSTMINNTIIKSAMVDSVEGGYIDESERPKKGEISKVYIYVSLENTIEEAFMRTYEPLFDISTKSFLTQIAQGVPVEQRLKEKLLEHNATIIMKYFPAMTMSCVDLMGIVDEAINEYGKEKIAGLYVDYLDLLKTDSKYDLYRIELGHITLGLKTLAVQYNIPVITGTQLTRDVYKITESKDLNIAQMSESIKKVEHADFVLLLAKDKNDDSVVHGKIGKHRSGKSNISLKFDVDFTKFKFINVDVPRNEESSDSSNDDIRFKGTDKSLMQF